MTDPAAEQKLFDEFGHVNEELSVLDQVEVLLDANRVDEAVRKLHGFVSTLEADVSARISSAIADMKAQAAASAAGNVTNATGGSVTGGASFPPGTP